MRSKMNKEDYLKECCKVLDYMHKDYSGDTIELNSGDYSCIMNPNSEFYELFGGYSIWSIAEFVAKELNKKIIWENEDY